MILKGRQKFSVILLCTFENDFNKSEHVLW